MAETNPYDSPRSSGTKSSRFSRSMETAGLGVWDLAVLGIALAAGWGLWAFSPALFGENEPWDGTFLHYQAALFLTGLTCAAIRPSGLLSGPVGTYLGQVAYMTLEYGDLILPWLSAGFFGFLPALIGAVIGATWRWGFRWLQRRSNGTASG